MMDKFEKIIDNIAGLAVTLVLFAVIVCSLIAGFTDYWKPETVTIKLKCSDLQIDINEPCNYTVYIELKVENGGIKPFDIWCPKCFSELMWYMDRGRR